MAKEAGFNRRQQRNVDDQPQVCRHLFSRLQQHDDHQNGGHVDHFPTIADSSAATISTTTMKGGELSEQPAPLIATPRLRDHFWLCWRPAV